MRRTTTLIVGVVAALTMGAAPSGAAETVGSDLTRAPVTFGGSDVAVVQAAKPDASSLPITATQTGVITKLRIKHASTGADPGTVEFLIATGNPPTYTVRSHPRFTTINVPVGAGAGILEFIPKDGNGAPQGVPINVGERVAVVQGPGHDAFDFFYLATPPGSVINYRQPIPSPGSPAVAWDDENLFEVLLQYSVEPDADSDGYGDETQDACLGVAGLSCSPACANPTKVGTSGNDVIFGTTGNDVIAANGGDDVVRGLGGDDVICGGDGRDKLKGGAGKDTLYGDAGRDKLNGGGSKDRCFGGADKDAIGCEKAKQN